MVDDYQSAISANKKVKAVKEKLGQELQSVNDVIETEKSKMTWLHNSYLPLDDLKEGIIQFLSVQGQMYEKEQICPAISMLATNGKFGVNTPAEKVGMPMQFQDLELAIDGTLGGFWGAQIIQPDKTFFDDRAFLCLLFKFIEPALRTILDNMEPSEFGYDRVKPDEIGPGLEERRKMIQDVAVQLLALDQQKADITNKLQELET